MKTKTTNKTNRRTKKTKKPAKYYGCQLEQIKAKKYGFFIDYMVLNLTGEYNDETANGLNVVKHEYGTRNFLNRYEIANDNFKIGVLLTEQRNPLVKIEGFSQFKIDNHLFYLLPMDKLKELVRETLQGLGFEFYSGNRLDLALDLCNASGKVQKMLQKIGSNEYIFGGKPKDINEYKQTTKNGIVYNGVQIGSRSSSRFARFYNKTQEMNDKGVKEYIVKAHEQLELTGEVWRLEYQLSSSFLRQIKGLTFDDFFNMDYLFSLYEKACENHFKIHIKTRAKETNKMPLVNFLDFNRVKKYLRVISKPILKLSRTIKETLIGQKRQVKSLLRSYFSTGQKLEFLLPVKHILNDFDLMEWYNNKLPHYVTEFKRAEIIKTFDRKTFNEHLQIEI